MVTKLPHELLNAFRILLTRFRCHLPRRFFKPAQDSDSSIPPKPFSLGFKEAIDWMKAAFVGCLRMLLPARLALLESCISAAPSTIASEISAEPIELALVAVTVGPVLFTLLLAFVLEVTRPICLLAKLGMEIINDAGLVTVEFDDFQSDAIEATDVVTFNVLLTDVGKSEPSFT